MKLMASGVIFSAAMVRSPSFSRSSSSMTTIMRPARISSSAVSTSQNGDGLNITAHSNSSREGLPRLRSTATSADFIIGYSRSVYSMGLPNRLLEVCGRRQPPLVVRLTSL